MTCDPTIPLVSPLITLLVSYILFLFSINSQMRYSVIISNTISWVLTAISLFTFSLSTYIRWSSERNIIEFLKCEMEFELHDQILIKLTLFTFNSYYLVKLCKTVQNSVILGARKNTDISITWLRDDLVMIGITWIVVIFCVAAYILKLFLVMVSLFVFMWPFIYINFTMLVLGLWRYHEYWSFNGVGLRQTPLLLFAGPISVVLILKQIALQVNDTEVTEDPKVSMERKLSFYIPTIYFIIMISGYMGVLYGFGDSSYIQGLSLSNHGRITMSDYYSNQYLFINDIMRKVAI